MRKWILLLMIIAAIAPMAAAQTGGGGTNPIPPPPTFSITTNVTTVCRGEVNLIPITASVTGSGAMENTEIGLASGKGLYTLGNSTIALSTINSTSPQTGILPIFVSSNASFVQAGISVNYYYYTIYTDSETRNLSLWITQCPLPLTVNVTPKVLISGKIQNITFSITNTGSTPLNSISIKTTFPSQYAAVLDNQPIPVGSITGGSTKQIQASVYVYNNASQLLPALVNVTFFNGVLFEESLNTVDLLTGGTINLTTSSLTISPTPITPSGIFSVSFVLTNTGTDGASALSATALPAKGFSAFGSSNSVFVGDVGADSQTPVTLTFVASNSLKGGNYTIPIRISYLNSFRDNVSMTMNVPVTVAGTAFSSNSVARSGTGVTEYRSGASGSGIAIIVVLIVVVAVESVLIFKMRKGRHPK